ncbi:MAG: thioredoxin domain-containing protein [Deltaproteobacteria bacterium]
MTLSKRHIFILVLFLAATAGPGCRSGGGERGALSGQSEVFGQPPPGGHAWAVPEQLPGAAPYPGRLRSALAKALTRMPASYRPRTHHLELDGAPTFTNRLVFETSPYLLQHAHNPVNWYPWSDEAFDAARRLGRPILLSVGYATCHWCHVMERESFEDTEIAAFLNANYVAIKVDREERPDIDNVYMDAVRVLSGGGGWPMTVVMTPEARPFFGGTYFPARDGDRGTRIGFLTILERLAHAYTTDREGVVAKAAEISERLLKAAAPRPPGAVPGATPLRKAYASLSKSFDAVYGGFGGAPKFPRSVTLEFLLRYHRRTGDEQALHMAVYTLERMAKGGIYDHVGGGFHRYSTDSRWLVPHFEKMLYDNALLVVAYVEAFQITGREDLARVVTELLDYVSGEMSDREGGFHSATDADSPTPGGHEEEGYFFTWTPDELAGLLGDDLARLVSGYYGVTERGNFEGRSILNTPRPLARVAKELGMSVDDIREELDGARELMYEKRGERPPPGKDDKIVAAWNGLMISAFARAAQVFGRDRYAQRAESAAEFIVERMMTEQGRLHRSYRSGRARYDGILDDYAFVAAGMLDLFETTHDLRWLDAARQLHATLESSFWDEENGGFFLTADFGETLLTRDKPYYDGAEPSGNAVAVSNLLRLYELTTDDGYLELAEMSLAAFARVISRNPTALPKMLSALDYYLDSPKEIVIIKPDRSADVWAFREKMAGVFLPNRVLAVISTADVHGPMAEAVPLIKGKVARAGKVTAYVCERRVCKLPTSDPEVFGEQISTVRPYP